MFRKFQKHAKSILSGLTFAAIIVLIQYHSIFADKSILNRVDGMFYDLRLNFSLTPRQFDDVSILILDIDERSLREQGRWPWSRVKVAELIEKLADAGVVVIAFDVLFGEPERNPVDSVAPLLSTQLDDEQLNSLKQALDADSKMAESLTYTDVVLSVLFHNDHSIQDAPVTSFVKADVADSKTLSILSFEGFTANIPKLQQATPGTGFLNSAMDSDGFIRRASLLIEYNGQVYPSLALEAARLYSLAEEIPVKTTASAEQINHIDSIVINNKSVKTDAEGRLLIPYRGGQRSFQYISATDILNDKLDMQAFDSSVVFVGSSAVGLADLRSTPVGLQYPGVEVHANVLEALMHPEIIHYRPDWWEAGTLLFISLTGLVLAVVLPMLSPIKMALVGSTSLLLTLAGNYLLWTEAQLALPVASSLLMILVITIYNITDGFFSEATQKKFIKSIFDQYVPPAHIDSMLEDPSALNLEGERKQMSVLFSDIRSFTSISEKLSAAELKQLLNRYFNPITESIFNHNGTIDKYVGDMVMAFWGAPLDDPKHAQNSILCAFEMLAITEHLRAEFKADGLPEVHVGVGINTGEMNVGDMGSEFRRAYTVLGDAVNLGSRLEGLTKFYGVELLVSEFTKADCPDLNFRLIDKVRVKGKDKAVAIYEPINPLIWNNETAAELSDYEQAYDQYLQQNWPEAEQMFLTLDQLHKRKLYSVYLQRIVELKQLPKQQHWDGSFTHTSK